MQSILPLFDLIVGTEEEFCIAGGSENLLKSLKEVRKINKGILLVKLGALGCAVIENEIPTTLNDADIYPGSEVDVLNVLGAGDAFLSGFLSGWAP